MTTGCSNVFLGYGAGQNTSSGDCNIAIASNVCLTSATGDGQLAIGYGTDRWITGDSSFNHSCWNSSHCDSSRCGKCYFIQWNTSSSNLSGALPAISGANLTNLPTGINTGGTSTFSELVATGDITANGNIIGDNSTNISGISSVTASTLYGDGSNLTGITAGNGCDWRINS